MFHNFIYLFLAVLGLCCSLHHSRSSVQASHCGGFSCCRARALGHADFSSCRLWALEHGPNIWWKGFIDPRYVGSSWIRDQTPVSCIGRQILYCWATREAPEPYTLKEWMLWHIKHISIVLFQNKKGRKGRDFPSGPATDSTLPMSGARVQAQVRHLDRTCSI